MSKKKNDKKIMSLEPTFQDVLVCRNPKNRPYLEIFVARPENISQENLGNISGVFEIVSASEDSSYVVNYLISVIKKEYFSRPKRGAVESFESALHKANLALSKLASHGNVDWIGHLNAVCIVIEKNNLHVSYTGTASALLLRSNMLTNISEGGESINEPNPLKTFQDVLSGRMENNDKLIITTDSIFEIFSMEEIKRSALRFSQPEFIQFLNTALINELERASVLVIDMAEKEEEEIVLPRKSPKVNAFSQTSFQKNVSDGVIEKKQEEKREMIEELKEEYQKTQDGFVDKKTGHIYIKDGDASYENRTSRIEYFSSSKENLVQTGSNFWTFSKKNIGYLFSKLKPRKFLETQKTEDAVSNEEFYQTTGQTPIVIKEEISKGSFSFKEKIGPALRSTAVHIGKTVIFIKNILLYKILAPLYRGIKYLFILLVSKYKSDRIRPVESPKRPQYSYLENSKPSSLANFFLPSFSRIRGLIKEMTLAQKIFVVFFVAVLIIVPYLIVHYENRFKKQAASVQEIAPKVVLPLEQDKNVARVETLANTYQGENILSMVNINGKNFAIKSNEIISIDDNKNYPLPDNFQNPDFVSQMDDLNFIFIIKNKQIASFSATARKFQDNNISFPDGTNIISAQSYLTYLYVLDSKNNQIYRYPRAEGGFGDKTNWLKETADFSNAKDMAINDNIYVTDGKQIMKLFRGKKQDYLIEETATNIIPDKLYIKPTGENLYILDKTNSRIVKLGSDGKIIMQYYNSEIGNAKDFSVDEENNMVYVSNENSVKSFSIST